MTARKLATPTNAELDANPERLRIVAKSNVEKAFYEADSKERITACLNTTTIRVLAAMLGELTGKSYNPEDACKEYWVARVAEYFIHIRKVRLHEKIRTHSITEIQNNPAFSQLQDLVGGMGYTTAYAILRASAAKDLKAMCKAFNLKNISRLNQKRIYAQLLVDFADEYWLLYSDFDERNNDSQPELPATADDAISANDNDTALASQPAAVASTQSEKNAQPEIIKFVVGKTYKSVFSQSGYHFRYKFTVIDRHEKYITVRNENNGESARRTLHIDDNGVEWVNPRGTYASQKRHVLFADAPTVEPEITAHAEVSQPEALYMDDSYSDAPGDNSECARNQDFPVDFPECTHAEIAQPDLSASIDNNPLHHLKPCPNCRSTHIPFLKRCDDNNFSTATRRFNGGIARQHIYYRLKCRDCGHEVKATIYRTGLGRFVIPHQNDADVKNEVCQAWNKQYDDNPGITIVPSDEIEKPDYTVYPEPIIDECPYVTVSACDKPENTPRRNPITEAKFKWVNQFLLAVFFLCKFILPLYVKRSVIPPVVVPLMNRKTHNPVCDTSAALVPYAHAADIRKSYRLSAVLQRLMSASHIPPLDFIIPSKIKHSYFSVGYKYPAWVNHKKQFLTVTERVIRDNGRLDVRVSDEENGSFGFTPWTDERGNEYYYFVRWNEFCYASQGIRVKRRSNSIKFKLGFTYPALRNDALSANATVIAFDDVYTTGKNGKLKLSRHDIIFKTDSDNKCLKHLQTWTHIDDGVEIAEYNVYPAFVISADCYALGSNAPQSSNVTPRAVFSVGCDYSLDVHERKYTIHITARTNDTVSFSCDMLKAKRQEDTRIFTTPVAVDPDTKSENLYFLGNCRADEHKIAVQEVHAEINDITPQPKTQPKTLKHNPAPASDIEHKLIETKDLHFSERRKALDHNAAVISSCMFSEAVISLLSSISLQAILLLGFHMRLFIAKPKGKKNVIAGLFAKRLIECRELHANVRSNPANINAKYSASVPDGVKFFETKHRQLGFIFTE